MKITLSILNMLTASSVTAAQEATSAQEMNMSEEVFKISATIVVVVLIMLFVLSILKRMLDYRIKNRILDKGVPEQIVSSILRSNIAEDGDVNIRWFSLLSGLGIGLTVIRFTLPLGIHSLAIMSFSIALGFLGYHQYLKRRKK